MFAVEVLQFFKQKLTTINSNYLEIGVYNGDSICQLAKEFTDKIIIGIDPFIEDGCTTHNSGVKEGDSLINQKQNTMNLIANIPNIKFYEQTSIEFNKNLTNNDALDLNVGAIFIDGSHHYLDVKNDYNLAIKLLGKKYGFICFDDIHCDEVLTAMEEFTDLVSERIISIQDLTISARVFELKAL